MTNDSRKDYALIEVFNFYIRKNTNDRASDFEDFQLNLTKLSLRGFVSFAKDMQIPLDMLKLTTVWKKSSTNNT